MLRKFISNQKMLYFARYGFVLCPSGIYINRKCLTLMLFPCGGMQITQMNFSGALQTGKPPALTRNSRLF
jgi:hypothetical protein